MDSNLNGLRPTEISLSVLAVRDGRIAALRPLADGTEGDVAVGVLHAVHSHPAVHDGHHVAVELGQIQQGKLLARDVKFKLAHQKSIGRVLSLVSFFSYKPLGKQIKYWAS